MKMIFPFLDLQIQAFFTEPVIHLQFNLVIIGIGAVLGERGRREGERERELGRPGERSECVDERDLFWV